MRLLIGFDHFASLKIGFLVPGTIFAWNYPCTTNKPMMDNFSSLTGPSTLSFGNRKIY